MGEVEADAPVGARCRAMREAASVSLRQMGVLTHRDASTLWRFEAGQTTPKDVAQLVGYYEQLKKRAPDDAPVQRDVATHVSRRIAQARIALAVFLGVKLTGWITIATLAPDNRQFAAVASRVQGVTSAVVLLAATVAWARLTDRGWPLRLHLAAAAVILAGIGFRNLDRLEIAPSAESIVVSVGMFLMLVALMIQLDPDDPPWLR